MSRRISRIILAIAFGLSAVLLPVRAGFAVAAPTAHAATATMPDHHAHHQHTQSPSDRLPCDQSPSDTSQKPHGDCGSMIGCALSCGSFTAVAFSSIVYVPVEGAVLRPLRVSEAIASQRGTPPFRPPRG